MCGQVCPSDAVWSFRVRSLGRVVWSGDTATRSLAEASVCTRLRAWSRPGDRDGPEAATGLHVQDEPGRGAQARKGPRAVFYFVAFSR